MRPCEIDRSGDVWVYRPATHKNTNKKKVRAVPLVGDARDAIVDYLNRDPDAYLFSPAESYAWYQAKKRSARKTKVQPSQADRSKADPRKKPRCKYDAGSYRRAIQDAAKKAGVPSWHPYQLRHLAATVVRDVLGLEGAQALLGHSDLKVTQRYAKMSERLSPACDRSNRQDRSSVVDSSN
ncbi:MAG: tyrosine-type recombinase/integrase [Planctomycetota bacterium]